MMEENFSLFYSNDFSINFHTLFNINFHNHVYFLEKLLALNIPRLICSHNFTKTLMKMSIKYIYSLHRPSIQFGVLSATNHHHEQNENKKKKYVKERKKKKQKSISDSAPLFAENAEDIEKEIKISVCEHRSDMSDMENLYFVRTEKQCSNVLNVYPMFH